MKASILIEKLQALIAKGYDLDVCFYIRYDDERGAWHEWLDIDDDPELDITDHSEEIIKVSGYSCR